MRIWFRFQYKKNENLGLIQPKFAFILFEFNQKNHIWIEIEQDM